MREPGQSPRNVGVSISETTDMRSFGLSHGHLKDAMAAYPIYLLSSGPTSAYGGDLCNREFTNVISELALRYRPWREAARNYLAWPVHAPMDANEIREFDEALRGFGRLILVTPDGHPMPCGEHRPVPPSAVDDKAWCVGLTGMRELICAEAETLIVLGGKLGGYKGAMPRIVEETLLAIKAKQPVFLVGGFGGCEGHCRGDRARGTLDRLLRHMAGPRTVRWLQQRRLEQLPHARRKPSAYMYALCGSRTVLVLRGLHRTRRGEQ